MRFIEKPWGSETIVEENGNYVVKKLFMKKDCQCSLQYHALKHETIVVLAGRLLVIHGTSLDTLEDQYLMAGDSIVLPPGIIHRMRGDTDCTYMECSTNHLDDVIRIQDDYGRK